MIDLQVELLTDVQSSQPKAALSFTYGRGNDENEHPQALLRASAAHLFLVLLKALQLPDRAAALRRARGQGVVAVAIRCLLLVVVSIVVENGERRDGLHSLAAFGAVVTALNEQRIRHHSAAAAAAAVVVVVVVAAFTHSSVPMLSVRHSGRVERERRRSEWLSECAWVGVKGPVSAAVSRSLTEPQKSGR